MCVSVCERECVCVLERESERESERERESARESLVALVHEPQRHLPERGEEQLFKNRDFNLKGKAGIWP